jgi:hypothetical protein
MIERRDPQSRIDEADYIIYLDDRPHEVANKQVTFDPRAMFRGLFWGIIFGTCLWVILYWIGEHIR